MRFTVTNESQAYIKKGHIPIQVFPVPNAHTNSFVVCSCILYRSRQQKIGVCIRDRKSPFHVVNLWSG